VNAESSGKEFHSFPFANLRVIPFDFFNGAFNMACDMYLARQVNSSQIPVLRFYGWQPFCLSLGFHQKSEDVDTHHLKNSNIDLVRRPTGGSAILHAEELTYSFIIPNKHYSHHTMYKFFHVILAAAFNRLGYPVSLSGTKNSEPYLNKGSDTFACFNRAAQSEIHYNGKKIVGSAQKVYKNSILQHGSIIIGSAHEQIIKYLNVEDTEKDVQQNILKSNSISLKDVRDRNISEISLSETIVDEFSFHTHSDIFYQYLKTDEMNMIQAMQNNLKVIG